MYSGDENAARGLKIGHSNDPGLTGNGWNKELNESVKGYYDLYLIKCLHLIPIVKGQLKNIPVNVLQLFMQITFLQKPF